MARDDGIILRNGRGLQAFDTYARSMGDVHFPRLSQGIIIFDVSEMGKMLWLPDIEPARQEARSILNTVVQEFEVRVSRLYEGRLTSRWDNTGLNIEFTVPNVNNGFSDVFSRFDHLITVPPIAVTPQNMIKTWIRNDVVWWIKQLEQPSNDPVERVFEDIGGTLENALEGLSDISPATVMFSLAFAAGTLLVLSSMGKGGAGKDGSTVVIRSNPYATR